MSSDSAHDVVERYFDLFASKKYTESRALLSDDQFSFSGPIDKFNNADDFIAAVSRLAPIIEDIRKRKVFADGDEACVIYDFVAKPPVAATVPICEWFHVEGDKISSIVIMFDPRPFVALFQGPH